MLPLCHECSPLDINFCESNGLNYNYNIENEYLTKVEVADSSKHTIILQFTRNYDHKKFYYLNLRNSHPETVMLP